MEVGSDALQPRFYGRVLKYIGSLGVQPLFREVKGEAHALEFVAHGFGLALLPRSAARITHAGTVFKPLTDRYLGIETVLFMRRDQGTAISKIWSTITAPESPKALS
jgi:DNA-binding transcriptional LysR family regulator